MALWKQIADFPKYSVSDEGQVRNDKTGRILKPATNNNGYLFVTLFRDGKRNPELVHRLVATEFIANPENKPHVNHKDGTPSRNSVDNLEWCTPSENHIHRCHVLGHGPSKDHLAKITPLANKSRRKTVFCVETGTTYESVTGAAQSIGRHYSALILALKGKTQTCAGFHWRYI